MFIKIADQFKKPSGLLGRLVSTLMIRGNNHAYKTILPEMKISEEDTLLEIGFGPGSGIKEIFSRFQPKKLYGVDFSPLMIERASRLNKALIQQDKVHLLLGDFMDADLSELTFDKVFCLNVVYFWEELVAPFSKIHNILKPGGKFHFYMASKEDLDRLKFTDDDVFNKHSIEKVEDCLKNAGFSNVKHFYKNGYFVEGSK